MNPVPENKSFIKTIARLVSQKGLELEKTLMSIDTNSNGKNYSFLCDSDPCHPFYKQKLNKYRNEVYFPLLTAHRYRCHSFRYPKKSDSMSLKDFGVIKLTAQFVARYGWFFLRGLRDKLGYYKPQFEFLERSSTRFDYYYDLVRAYATVLRPCTETLISNDARFNSGLFPDFFDLLQLEKLEKGDVMALIDLHAFVSGVDRFAHFDDEDYNDIVVEPAYLSAMMRQYPEMHPLGSNHLTTTTTTQAQPVELRRPRSSEYEFLENQITLNELGVIKLTAQFVARYGPRFRRDLMKKVVMNPLFEFLKPTDDGWNNKSRFFNLIEYRYSRVLLPSDQLLRSEDGCTAGILEFFSKYLQLEKLEDGVEMATVDLHAFVGGLDFFTHMHGASYDYLLPPPERLSMFMGSQLCNPQNHQDCCVDDDDDDAQEPFFIRRTFRFPAKGITLKELGTIMLTAQFVARYGMYFIRGLRKEVVLNRQFGFMLLSDRRYYFYSGLVNAYHRVLRRSKDMEESDACTASVLERFFEILRVLEMEEEEAGLFDFVGVVDCFAHFDDEEYRVVMPPPVHLLMNMIPPILRGPGTLVLPPPKRSRRATIHQYCADLDLDDPKPHPFREPPLRPATTMFHDGLSFTRKEACIIKATAQFEARYGVEFMRALMTRVAEKKKPQEFEFMEPTSGSRFGFYSQLVEFYSRVLLPWKKFDADTVLEGFFNWVDRFQQEGLDLAMGCLNDFVSSLDCFADIDGVPIPPPHVSFKLAIPGRACDQSLPPLMQPPAPPLAVPLPEEPEPKTAPPPAVPLPVEPKPKRRKIDDESALAQHIFQGSSTSIRVFVPDVGEVVFRKNRSKFSSKCDQKSEPISDQTKDAETVSHMTRRQLHQSNNIRTKHRCSRFDNVNKLRTID